MKFSDEDKDTLELLIKVAAAVGARWSGYGGIAFSKSQLLEFYKQVVANKEQ